MINYKKKIKDDRSKTSASSHVLPWQTAEKANT